MSLEKMELLNELIAEIKLINYSERKKLKELHSKTIKVLAEMFDPTNKHVLNAKLIDFEPTKPIYLEMSVQLREESWNSGKLKLLQLLNEVSNDILLPPKVISLQQNFANRESTIQSLHNILNRVHKNDENLFLEEAIKCYEVGAWRASIIMVWNLTLDHLYEFVISKELIAFNNVLTKNTDKRIKITVLTKKDDFGEIPENKFIEFCRSANIISNDVRKILEAKLGIRNTYAHPSNVSLSESKVLDFIEDLVGNVILKFDLPL